MENCDATLGPSGNRHANVYEIRPMEDHNYSMGNYINCGDFEMSEQNYVKMEPSLSDSRHPNLYEIRPIEDHNYSMGNYINFGEQNYVKRELTISDSRHPNLYETRRMQDQTYHMGNYGHVGDDEMKGQDGFMSEIETSSLASVMICTSDGDEKIFSSANMRGIRPIQEIIDDCEDVGANDQAETTTQLTDYDSDGSATMHSSNMSGFGPDTKQSEFGPILGSVSSQVQDCTKCCVNCEYLCNLVFK